MQLRTVELMELRGIEQKVSKKTGKVYFVGHFECSATGAPKEVYLGEEAFSLVPAGSKKGDVFYLTFGLNNYGDLSLTGVEVG